jgi:NhaP-type Na+/H+ or K+/H+ antiporter
MIASIAGFAIAVHVILQMPWTMSLLLAAILAPTDPVLASAVTVSHAQDHDRVRYALSGEAGLNDGAAFPFVILALALIAGPFGRAELGAWVLVRLLWAVPAGLLLGFLLGKVIGRIAIALRARQRDTAAPTDFLALALIALSYSAAEAMGAWGFLAVFAAGLGLRHAEISTVQETPHPQAPDADVEAHPPAETLVAPNVVTEDEISQPAVAAGVLVAEVFSFGDTVERLLEVFLVVLVGVALAGYWDVRAVTLALLLFVVIRPLASMLMLVGTPTSPLQRGLLGWFGIRGIGSLYYLAYALNHGLESGASRQFAGLVLSIIALSVVVHGLTARPLLRHYERTLAAPEK